MKKLIHHIIPMLLTIVLVCGMVPASAFAAEADPPTSIAVVDVGEASSVPSFKLSDDTASEVIVVPSDDEQSQVLPDSPDIIVVPDSDDSISGDTLPPAVSDDSGSNSVSSSSEGTEEQASSESEPMTTAEDAGESDVTVQIVRMGAAGMYALRANGNSKLVVTKHAGYQFEISQGVEPTRMSEWPSFTIDGRLAYCVDPYEHATSGSKPYGQISYDKLTSGQRYAIGYAMLYGAQSADNVPLHIATQTVIWEIAAGFMDVESLSATNHTIYNCVIGYNPSAAPYYEQLLAQMRAHKEVPSFTHFFRALAPVHKMAGVPGDYQIDLTNTNPACDLADFNFQDQAGVTFVKDKQVLHVTASAAVSATELFGAFKGSVGETNSLIFWTSTDNVDQVKATADVLDPVPCYFRLSTEDVGEYSIEVDKLELGTNIPLAGAEFEIRHSEKGVVGVYTTDGSGKIKATVPWKGTYIIKELTPPKNHLLDENSTKDIVVSTENQHPAVTFHNEKFSGIEITKIDAMTKAPISGVTFRVARKSSGESQDAVTAANGIATLPNLAPDWYVITEVSCPPGYILDSTPHTVEVKGGEVCAITLENYAKPSLEIAKVDEADPSIRLAGATFRIAQKGSKEYQDITTGPDGIARLTGLQPDYYTIVEIVAPDGYILSDQEQTVEIIEGKVTTVTIPNGKKPTLAIEKIDSITKQQLPGAVFEIAYKNGATIGRFTTDENGHIELPQIEPGLLVVLEISAPAGYITTNAPQEVLLAAGETKTLTFENTPKSPVILKKVDAATGEPLKGAKFRLTKMNGELVGEYTTGRNGYITVPGLEPGWYVAVEIAAPEGYRLDNTPQQVELKLGDPAILEFENELLPGLQIRKVDAVTEKSLEGVRIRLTKKTGDVIGDFTTNAAGLITIPDLEEGWYTAYETATIDGYILDMTPQDVQLKTGQAATLTFRNTPLSGLSLLKLDSVTGKGLADVGYEIRKQDGTLLGIYTTDSTGRIYVPDLEEGVLVIRELKAPAGYKLDTAEQTVEIKAGEANTVTFLNHPYPYMVLQKVDAETQAPLAGAKFRLCSDNGKELGTYTTNDSGRITLTGMSEGHYTVQEVEAPEGYTVDDTVYNVYLKWGQTTTLTVKNTVTRIKTHVDKRGVTETFAGDLIRYDFSNIQNLSTVPLDDFYWHDLLPTDAVRLDSIYTGTWNEELTYKVLYKTNLKQDWAVLQDGLSTLQNHKLSCSVQVLGLASNEYVTEFRFEFGTVKVGFQEETAPYIFTRVLADLPNQYQFVNRTDVGGRHGKYWTYDKDAWVTVTWKNEKPKKLPKTGEFFVEQAR